MVDLLPGALEAGEYGVVHADRRRHSASIIARLAILLESVAAWLTPGGPFGAVSGKVSAAVASTCHSGDKPCHSGVRVRWTVISACCGAHGVSSWQ